MSTVTSHTLLSRPARYSAGVSPGCMKPSVASFPRAPAGKTNRPRSLCYSADPKSTDHQFSISPVALVHPGMPNTSTDRLEIKENDNNVELTFHLMPKGATPEEFRVAVEGDVLMIRTKPEPEPPQQVAEQQEEPAGGSVSFDVRLFVPERYDRKGVRAELNHRNLLVTVPKIPISTDAETYVFKKEVTIERK
ncbi:hypothetical protein ACP70R_020663 [Stipagrostis hirtigluma subsp. patula]